MKKTKPRRDQLKPDECLRAHCTDTCCRYSSLPIETPSTWDDSDAIRWYLAHGSTLGDVERETWYLVVMTRCTHLTYDNRCRSDLSRPKICQEYATSDCEYDDWMCGKVFEIPEQTWEDAEAVLPPGLNPRRRGAALPVIEIDGVAQEVQ
ncbi:MAG: YkgJ family cysteine cluster protein [Singulisphaera sp.]|nr:YkgJ family cysteine cluster protein [Singulisphaera sp.]